MNRTPRTLKEALGPHTDDREFVNIDDTPPGDIAVAIGCLLALLITVILFAVEHLA